MVPITDVPYSVLPSGTKTSSQIQAVAISLILNSSGVTLHMSMSACLIYATYVCTQHVALNALVGIQHVCLKCAGVNIVHVALSCRTFERVVV